MSFKPIQLRDYVRKYLKSNAGSNEREVTGRLRDTLAEYKAGARCGNCGAPIWVIGSAEVGNMCFTCITGEADPSEDYEIAEACRKFSAPGKRSESYASLDDVFIRSGVDEDVPF
jgi:hypothetical protein